jgi:predicted nucleic-acid-binding Zn-ribbon protein
MEGCDMSEENKCLRCGGANCEPGSIQSNGRVAFRAQNARFVIAKTGDIPVNANICLDCGYVELVGDVDKAKSLIKAS